MAAPGGAGGERVSSTTRFIKNATNEKGVQR
jgi:hypothetical protein